MIDQVQKSHPLIKFQNSSIDQKHQATDQKIDSIDGMLKLKSLSESEKKNISYRAMVELFLSSNTDVLDLEDEVMRDIIVIYGPFVERMKLEHLIEESVKNNSVFGQVYFESKALELMGFKEGYFDKRFVFDELFVLKREIDDQITLSSKADFKLHGLKLSLMEAQIYCSIEMNRFYECEITEHVSVFNKLTDVFVSQILREDSEEVRVKCVKNLMKLAKHLFNSATMNSFSACVLALQRSTVHRLKLIERMNHKYKKMYELFSGYMSPENNFKNLRERPCLIPWFGLLLRDFTFIREVIYSKGFKTDIVINIPLGLCLRRLVLPILASRDACYSFLKDKQRDGQISKGAAILKKWLQNGTGIIYVNETKEFSRSERISK